MTARPTRSPKVCSCAPIWPNQADHCCSCSADGRLLRSLRNATTYLLDMVVAPSGGGATGRVVGLLIPSHRRGRQSTSRPTNSLRDSCRFRGCGVRRISRTRWQPPVGEYRDEHHAVHLARVVMMMATH